MIGQIDERLAQSVAEIDENIRIFNFLNHYVPQLKSATKTVPISQDQLEKKTSYQDWNPWAGTTRENTGNWARM